MRIAVSLDWSMKPCETHGGVADTRNLDLPQKQMRSAESLVEKEELEF